MKRFLVLALLLSSAVALAQSPAPGAGDELSQALFPPELVMKHRQDINLNDQQAATLKEMMQKAQHRFVDLQWDMQTQTARLGTLLKARPVDPAAALAQVDRVLTVERDVKIAQLSLLIGIKNLLSNAQQDQLAELRRRTP